MACSPCAIGFVLEQIYKTCCYSSEHHPHQHRIKNLPHLGAMTALSSGIRDICLLKIKIMLESKPLRGKASLVSLQRTISSLFDSVHRIFSNKIS